MQSAALDEHHVVFCIEHCWLSYLPEIMNPIEAVLEGSEIPNLFGDDLETIAKPLKSLAQQDGFQESLVAYFWFSKFVRDIALQLLFMFSWDKIAQSLLFNVLGIRQRLHIAICLESESHHTDELFDEYPALYKCVEIIWLASTKIASADYLAKELLEKFSIGEISPVPKYLAILDECPTDWMKSAYRFEKLILTYGTIYKNMLSTIQKQQNILQVKCRIIFYGWMKE